MRARRRIARTLAAEWAEFEQKLMGNEGFTANHRFNYRAAFYGGASRALMIVQEALDDEADDALIKAFAALDAEFMTFTEEMQAQAKIEAEGAEKDGG
jgi:hypothetical protein